MRVVADSHAIVWHLQGSSRISKSASDALAEAEATEGVVVSVATLVDLWYVTETTRAVSSADLTRLKESDPQKRRSSLRPRAGKCTQRHQWWR